MGELVAVIPGFLQGMAQKRAEERGMENRLRYLQESMRLQGEQAAAQQQHEANIRAAEWFAGGAERATKEHERRRKEAFENEEAKRRRREEKRDWLDYALKMGLITPDKANEFIKTDPDLKDIFGFPSEGTSGTSTEDVGSFIKAFDLADRMRKIEKGDVRFAFPWLSPFMPGESPSGTQPKKTPGQAGKVVRPRDLIDPGFFRDEPVPENVDPRFWKTIPTPQNIDPGFFKDNTGSNAPLSLEELERILGRKRPIPLRR